MTDIATRLEREEYHVDTKAVAIALVERLLAGRAVPKAPRVRFTSLRVFEAPPAG